MNPLLLIAPVVALGLLSAFFWLSFSNRMAFHRVEEGFSPPDGKDTRVATRRFAILASITSFLTVTGAGVLVWLLLTS